VPLAVNLMTSASRGSRLTMRVLALAYLAVLLAIPVAMVFYRTFEHGFSAAWEAVTEPAAQHAFWLTLEMVAIAVPLNTIFGIGVALALVRGRWRGKTFVSALIDLPFAVSPVVVGLALILVYGNKGWIGTWFADEGVRIIFSTPGMILATIFVSLPFVVREVVPVLRDRHRAGGRRQHARRVAAAGVRADHAARYPLGRRLRRHPHDRSRARRVRRRRRRLGQDRGPDRDRDAVRRAALSGL